MARTRRFGRATRLLLVLAAALVAVLIAETIVRLADLAPRIYAVDVSDDESAFRLSANPLLGYEMKAGHRNAGHVEDETHFSTNSHGQRDVERKLRKPAGTRRVLLLGDSVVQGIALADPDQTISRQLEQLLGDSQTEVLNFGVVGYNTRAEVELLRVKGLQFDPDVVVLVFVSNDYANYNLASRRNRFAFEERPFADLAFSSSALFRFAALRLDLFGYRTATSPEFRDRTHEAAMGDDPVGEGLAQLRRLSEEHGFAVLVGIWPTFGWESISHLEYVRDIEHPARLEVEAVAERHGLETFRFSDHFDRDYRERLRRLDGSSRPPRPLELYTSGDGMHPNRLGSQVAARALINLLQGR